MKTTRSLKAASSGAAGGGSTLVIVVVNYRTADHVKALLRSVGGSSVRPMGIVVVDNDSRDGSADELREFVATSGMNPLVAVLGQSTNGGFAAGNNAGVAHALQVWPRVESFFLLNPDTRLNPGTLHSLERSLVAKPRAGVVGAQVEDPSGDHECSGHVGDGPLWQLGSAAGLGILDRFLSARFRRIVSPARSERCDWVSGAALLIRRDAFADTGPMDEGFFLYFEEIDLCRRVRRAGWEVWLEPSSRVQHFEGASTGIARGRLPAYWFRSRRRLFVKQGGLLALLAADSAWLLGRGLASLAAFVRRRQTTTCPPCMVRDLVVGDVRAILTGDLHGS